MATGEPSTHGRRVEALDGLRGLAALAVVARHTLNALAMSEATRAAILQSPLGLVLSAQGAVRVFFVLSGYVLAGSLARGSGAMATVQFYVRRIFRIHPPYVAGVLFAWLAASLYSGRYVARDGAAVTQWLEHVGSVHLDFVRLPSFLWFPGDAGMQLPIGWTLYVEAIFSLALPLLVLGARPLRGIPLLAVSVGMLLAWPTALVPPHALDFALGVVSFRQRGALGRLVGSAPVALGCLGTLAALVLNAAPVVLGWSVPVEDILASPSDWTSGLLMSVGAWGLLAAALFRPWPRHVLSRRPAVAVGRVSYSLYLLHLPVLLACASPLRAPLGPIGGLALLAVVLVVSTLLAAAAWRCIERPSIAAGDAVCAWLARRTGAASLESST